MSPERIKALLNRRPFAPFTVVSGDRSSVDILSQEFAFLKPGGRTLEVSVPKKVRATEESDFEEHTIDVFLITKVMTPPKKNGRKSHK